MALTALALRIGSLRAIPPLRLLGVLIGAACLFGVLFLLLARPAVRLRRVPAGALAVCACTAAAVYGLMLASDDGFVVDIHRALGEALHLLPTAPALLLFVLGWPAGSPTRRLAATVLAVVGS